MGINLGQALLGLVGCITHSEAVWCGGLGINLGQALSGLVGCIVLSQRTLVWGYASLIPRPVTNGLGGNMYRLVKDATTGLYSLVPRLPRSGT